MDLAGYQCLERLIALGLMVLNRRSAVARGLPANTTGPELAVRVSSTVPLAIITRNRPTVQLEKDLPHAIAHHLGVKATCH